MKKLLLLLCSFMACALYASDESTSSSSSSSSNETALFVPKDRKRKTEAPHHPVPSQLVIEDFMDEDEDEDELDAVAAAAAATTNEDDGFDDVPLTPPTTAQVDQNPAKRASIEGTPGSIYYGTPCSTVHQAVKEMYVGYDSMGRFRVLAEEAEENPLWAHKIITDQVVREFFTLHPERSDSDMGNCSLTRVEFNDALLSLTKKAVGLLPNQVMVVHKGQRALERLCPDKALGYMAIDWDEAGSRVLSESDFGITNFVRYVALGLMKVVSMFDAGRYRFAQGLLFSDVEQSVDRIFISGDAVTFTNPDEDRFRTVWRGVDREFLCKLAAHSKTIGYIDGVPVRSGQKGNRFRVSLGENYRIVNMLPVTVIALSNDESRMTKLTEEHERVGTTWEKVRDVVLSNDELGTLVEDAIADRDVSHMYTEKADIFAGPFGGAPRRTIIAVNITKALKERNRRIRSARGNSSAVVPAGVAGVEVPIVQTYFIMNPLRSTALQQADFRVRALQVQSIDGRDATSSSSSDDDEAAAATDDRSTDARIGGASRPAQSVRPGDTATATAATDE